jgi:hypothetical protein
VRFLSLDPQEIAGRYGRNPSVEISGCPMTRSRKSRMK